jgi:hypothetical protein
MLEKIKMLLGTLSDAEKREIIRYLQGGTATSFPGLGEATQKGLHTGPMNTSGICSKCGK